MKARLNSFLITGHQSFTTQLSGYYHALNDLHYHAELEIIYIIEGRGTLLIGEQLEEIGAGMLLMIGSNVPHLFKFDKYTYLNTLMQQGKIDLPLKLLTLHVKPDVLGNAFLQLPENKLISQLLADAMRGIAFLEYADTPMLTLLYQLIQLPVEQRMLSLLQLLNTMGAHRSRKYLSSLEETTAYNDDDEHRLTKVYLYTLNNFGKNITLKEVAAMIYMVPNAFCRYFKQRTHKSYFTFLMEVRIRHACKLLKEHDYSVVVVCYESGFSNLSNFNRHFKLLTGKTPLQYRHFFRT